MGDPLDTQWRSIGALKLMGTPWEPHGSPIGDAWSHPSGSHGYRGPPVGNHCEAHGRRVRLSPMGYPLAEVLWDTRWGTTSPWETHGIPTVNSGTPTCGSLIPVP